MFPSHSYPILEFDENSPAVITPEGIAAKHGKFPYNKLVISFFKDAIDEMLREGALTHYMTLPGENDIVIYKFTNKDVLLIHGSVGCPACGSILDELWGFGIEKVMFCGGGGVLDRSIDVGKLMICTGAIRDEGFSYHYIKPSRILYTDEAVNRAIAAYLDEQNAEYFEGLCWTTDAIFRETRDKVAARREEGAKIVEMEQSGCIAVSLFRGISYGAIIYAGDDVSGKDWDTRSWHNRHGLRYRLIEICRDIVTRL